MDTLDQLEPGRSAVVTHIDNGPEGSEIREHLAARGIGPGIPVTVLRGGDPLIVAVDASRWAIGRDHARIVHVDRDDEEGSR